MNSPLLPPDRCLWLVERSGAKQICNGWPIPGSPYCAEHAAQANRPVDRASLLALLTELKELGEERVRSSTSVQSYWFWVGHCMALGRLQALLGLVDDRPEEEDELP